MCAVCIDFFVVEFTLDVFVDMYICIYTCIGTVNSPRRSTHPSPPCHHASAGCDADIRETEGVSRSYSEHAKRLLNETIAILRASSVAHVVHHPHDEAARLEGKNCIYGVARNGGEGCVDRGGEFTVPMHVYIHIYVYTNISSVKSIAKN